MSEEKCPICNSSDVVLSLIRMPGRIVWECKECTHWDYTTETNKWTERG